MLCAFSSKKGHLRGSKNIPGKMFIWTDCTYGAPGPCRQPGIQFFRERVDFFTITSQTSLYFIISVFSERFCGLTWWKQLGKDHTTQISSSSTSWEQPGPYQPEDRPPSGHPSVQRNNANTGKCEYVCGEHQHENNHLITSLWNFFSKCCTSHLLEDNS